MTKGCNVIIMILLSLILLVFFFNFIMYPEIYLTTWRYQLHNDLKAGDVQAQEYYQNTYLKKGKVLFDDIEINELYLINK